VGALRMVGSIDSPNCHATLTGLETNFSSGSLVARTVFMLAWYDHAGKLKEVLLPVETDDLELGFGLRINNNTNGWLALPAVLFTPEGDALNIFAECSVTNPNGIPSIGMWECGRFKTVDLTGIVLPNRMQHSFSFTADGQGYGGMGYDRITVWTRTVSHTRPTGRSYSADAAEVATVRIISRKEAAKLMAEYELAPPRSWYVSDCRF